MLKCVWGLDALECARCKGRMTAMAVVENPAAIARYLAHTGQTTVRPGWPRSPPSMTVRAGHHPRRNHPETGLGARECTNSRRLQQWAPLGWRARTPTGFLRGERGLGVHEKVSMGPVEDKSRTLLPTSFLTGKVTLR